MFAFPYSALKDLLIFDIMKLPLMIEASPIAFELFCTFSVPALEAHP